MAGSGYPGGGKSLDPVPHIALTKVEVAMRTSGLWHRYVGLTHAVGYVKAWARGELVLPHRETVKQWGEDRMKDVGRTVCGRNCGYQWNGPMADVECEDCLSVLAAVKLANSSSEGL